MISRHWTGVAKASEAERYIAHLRTETFPLLMKVEGFVEATILRRSVQAGVEFRIVTTWTSIDAVRRFAGNDAERAVVPENVRAMMITYDRDVVHYDVA